LLSLLILLVLLGRRLMTRTAMLHVFVNLIVVGLTATIFLLTGEPGWEARTFLLVGAMSLIGVDAVVIYRLIIARFLHRNTPPGDQARAGNLSVPQKRPRGAALSTAPESGLVG
jgi:hypothetical protein